MDDSGVLRVLVAFPSWSIGFRRTGTVANSALVNT